MNSSGVCQVLIKAYNLRNHTQKLVVHTDRGSQCTGYGLQNLLMGYGLRSSMRVEKCGIECFWGNLKHEWLQLVP